MSDNSSTTHNNLLNTSEMSSNTLQQQQEGFLADGWMDTLWAPPQQQTASMCDNINFDGSATTTATFVDFYASCDSASYGSCGADTANAIIGTEYQQLSPQLKLARPGPIGCFQQEKETRHQIQTVQPVTVEMPMEMGGATAEGGGAEVMAHQQNNSDICEQSPSECQLVVLRQPEEQHRARYASEGSRGAIKDRSGTSFCTIQLLGYYRPTRVELFAAQWTGANTFVEHSLYRLVPVLGKSATTTPCRRVVTEHGTERLEVTLRPENGMVVVLDCVGIMKICAYGTSPNSKNNSSKRDANPNCLRNAATNFRHRRRTKGRTSEERANGCGEGMTTTGQRTDKAARGCQNDVHIVAQMALPEGRVLRTHTDAIRCVQQLGCPEVMKMSRDEAPSSGGQSLFIVGRNFNPKNLRVLFREYSNDGSLGWSAEALLDQRHVHQCHIVCTVPTYHQLNRSALVSVTVICGPKQSHPVNFSYTACAGTDSDDDDWRPPDCATTANTVLNGYGHSFGASGNYGFGAFNQHIAYGNQNLRQKFATGGRCATEMANGGHF